MGGASFLLAINLSVAALFAAEFLGISAFGTKKAAAQWFAVAFVVGAFNYVFEYFIAADIIVPVAHVAGATSFVGALLAFAIGLSEHFSVPFDRRLALALLIGSGLLYTALYAMDRNGLVRQIIYQFPYALIQGLGLWIVWRSRRRGLAEHILLGLLALGTLHYLVKPFIANALGGVGATPDAYIDTTYALYSQAMGSVLAIAVALTMSMVMIGDIIRDIRAQAEMDEQTGLPNRRGFEMRVKTLPADPLGPQSLVLCELVGLSGLAPQARQSARDAAVSVLTQPLWPVDLVGLVDAETFALYCADSPIFTARRCAQDLMIGLIALPELLVQGHAPVTIAVGIAEAEPGDSFSHLMRRAEGALFEARRAGVNGIRLAPQNARNTPAALS